MEKTHNDHYQIQTENGSLKRVNIEHGLVDDAGIVALQDGLRKQLPALKLKDRADLHVTLFHFGKPEDLYGEIQKVHDGLDFDAFYHAFLVLMAETEKVVPAPVDTHGLALRLLGNHQEPVLALELRHAAVLNDAHHAVGQHFLHFLTAMGIEDMDAFVNSTYLKFQMDNHFLPHVSLGRLPSRLELPQGDVDLPVTLTPSRLRNVKVLEEGRWVWSH